MSVINEFEASVVKVSEADKYIHLISPQGSGLGFYYTFMCKVTELCVLFNMEDRKMLVLMPRGMIKHVPRYLCLVMGFHIENDLPVPSARYWQDTSYLPTRIGDQFKDKLASYTLDGIINS